MPRAGERGERRVNMRVGASGVSAGRGRASSAFRPEWQTNTIFILQHSFSLSLRINVSIYHHQIIYDDENEFSFYFSQEIKKLFLKFKILILNYKLYPEVQYWYIL